MKVKEYTSGSVEVEACDFHNHEKQLGHLPLPRKTIAIKLSEGVSISSILDYITDKIEGQMGRRELTNH